jgi:hypothetical protein
MNEGILKPLFEGLIIVGKEFRITFFYGVGEII